RWPRDWSSDVCSSDLDGFSSSFQLLNGLLLVGKVAMNDQLRRYEVDASLPTIQRNHIHVILHGISPVAHQVLIYVIFVYQPGFEIGRASCRERELFLE